VTRLSDVIKGSGDLELAREVRACPKPDVAATKAGSRFARRRSLFVCDDLWETDTNLTGFCAVLRKLIEQSAGSCMLFSTRNQTSVHRASVSGRVECTARLAQGSEATAVLCSHAELSQDMLRSTDDAHKNVETVLHWCDGLPLALAIFGRTIAESARRHGRTLPDAVHSFVSSATRFFTLD
jgi:NB-ARC domain